MGKFKQCFYTVILILTCFVASPFIFRQIWNNSKVKAHTETAKTAPTVENSTDITPDPANADDQSQTQIYNGDPQPVVTAPAAPDDASQTETPAKADFTFVRSDPSYFDDALFIGDSRMVGLSEYGTLKNADYFCSIGLAAYKIKTESIDGMTLESALSGKSYGKVYIMLGINEVGNDIEYTMSYYREMLDMVRRMQPDAVIYLAANLHVTAEAQSAAISNAGIDVLNSRISELADGIKVFYINVNSLFDGDNGSLNPEYTSDGVHVFAKYYATWCDWFCANTVQ